jgi:hypothetical protein
MKFNRLASCAALAFVLSALPDASSAFNETLSFRRTPVGTIEAVVSGLSDGPACQTEFVPPNSVVVAGNIVAINSPYFSHLCGIPFPPNPYAISVDLGALAGGPYQVTWTEGPLSVSGTLIPDSLPALVPVPVATPAAMAALILLIAASTPRLARKFS